MIGFISAVWSSPGNLVAVQSDQSIKMSGQVDDNIPSSPTGPTYTHESAAMFDWHSLIY